MTTETIECPACGALVPQVASATLTLALWQHWNWVCPKRETPADPYTAARDYVKAQAIIRARQQDDEGEQKGDA